MAQAVYDDEKSDDKLAGSSGSSANSSSSSSSTNSANNNIQSQTQHILQPRGLRAAEEGTKATSTNTKVQSSGQNIAAGLRSSEGEETGGFWSSENQTSTSTNTSDTSTDASSIRSAVTSRLRGNKKLLVGGGIGAAIALLLLILFIFLSTLLVPGLAENILTYEFAKVERQFDQDNNEVISEDAAVQAVSDPAAQSDLAGEFSNLSKSDNLFTKIKNLNPNNVFDNLQEDGTIKFNYAKNSKGLGYLDSVTVGDDTISVPSQTFTGKYFHPIEYFKGNVNVAQGVSDALENVMPDSGIGVLIRGRVEQLIMNSIDAPRFAWTASKFSGDDQQKADVEQQAEAAQAINPDPESDIAGSIVSPESGTIAAGAAAEQAAEQAEAAGQEVTTNGVPNTIPPLINGLTQSLENSRVTNFLKTFNPAYAIFLPLCIIYDGSIQNTGDAQQTINVNSAEDQRSFFYLEAAADQQKNGDTTGSAVGALNDKLGNDVEESIPMERANGQTVNTSNVTLSPQTAGNGEYTAINAFAPSLAPLINPLATTICPAITNPAFAGALTVVQIGGWFLGDEGAEAAADAGTVTADNLVQKAVGNSLSILDSLGLTEGNAAARGVAFVSKLQEVLPGKSEIGKIAGIAGLDVLVRFSTAEKMGELNDGFSQGSDFANQADAGANLNANQDMQQQYYGAPLSPQQVAYNNVQDDKFIADQYKSQSLYHRYLSPTNPESLVAKIGLDLYGDINKSFIPKFISNISKIFNPEVLFSSIYNVVNPSTKALADTVVSNDQSDYGIVQWGYTNYEESLINSTTNNTYQPLENDEVLAQYPNQVQQIQQNYGPCFTDSMAQLLTTMPSQGPDTGDYYITRNEQGDVVSGQCTDQYLGPSQATAGANSCADSSNYDPSDSMCDLVFRWRLQQAYDNTVDTLTGIANAGSPSQ